MSNPQQGNVALRMKFEQTCHDCGESDFVEDHASGDLICRSCGRVAESHVIDEGTEWRSFGDKVRRGRRRRTTPSRLASSGSTCCAHTGMFTL